MRLLAFTVSFLLAFLLFSVQPMATKMVLPTLGGTPAVWNTAMLTFQLLLLGGYAYAHWLSTRLAPQRQWQLHALLVLGSLVLLPLAVSMPSNATIVETPIRHLAWAFLLQIGLPFFVLSATAPLLQAWVSRSHHPLSDRPYVLYSASNLGSMLGLLGYVALVEPNFSLTQQSVGWSVLYVVGVAMLLRLGQQLAPSLAPVRTENGTVKPTRWQYALWMWLAFLPSSLSLGVTSYITTDIASVPLLWVMPLALYLLSFVDAFRTKPLLVFICQRVAPIFGMVGVLMYGFQTYRFSESFLIQLGIFGVLAFALHGWLARFKPAPAMLTQFYFCLSIGGALGGVMNAIVAPMVLDETFEYPISLILAALTAFMLWQRYEEKDETSSLRYHVRALLRVMATVFFNALAMYLLLSVIGNDWPKALERLNRQTMMMAASAGAFLALLLHRRYAHAFYACVTVGVIMLLVMTQGVVGTTTIYKKRNFFGVERVYDDPMRNARYMMHNTTVHGAQFIVQQTPLHALSYYTALTGVYTHLPAVQKRPIAVVGLGAGTLQCQARAGQRVDFYEINPLVVELAENKRMFRYLADCPGRYRILMGDGRIVMAAEPDGSYGSIVLDAFSSDAIPAHLLTVEALQMYMSKLAPGGVLLIHTTNRHIDLWPVIANQAKALGTVAYGKITMASPKDELVYSSFWVAMARADDDLAPLLANEKGWTALTPEAHATPWSDNFTNVLPYFKMFRD